MTSRFRKLWTVFGLLSTLLASGVFADTFSLRMAPEAPADGRAAALAALETNRAFLGDEDALSGEAPKSKSKAVLYSLVLPGWGQHYAGDKTGAAAFLAIEAATWTSFAVFEVQGYLREQGYQDDAQVFAGIAGDDHSDDYYGIIAEYDSWFEYEEAVKSEGRFALYPDAGAAELEEYFVENRVSDFEPWVWQSADDRRAFRSLRSDSKLSYRRGLYAVAVAAANRVASAFFAVKAVNDANRSLGEKKIGYRLEFGPPVHHPDAGPQTGVSLVGTF